MAIKLVRPARNSRRTVLPLAAGLNIFSSMPMISSSCCRTARPSIGLFCAGAAAPIPLIASVCPLQRCRLRPSRRASPRACAQIEPEPQPGQPTPLPPNSACLIENTAKSVIFAVCSQCWPASRAAGQIFYPKKARIPVKITCAAMAASKSPVSLDSTAMPVRCRARTTPSAIRSSTNMPKAAASSENTPTKT